MKKIILSIIIFFSVDVYSQEIHGHMVRVKIDSLTYASAARKQYLFISADGEFKQPTLKKEYHVLRLCIPKSKQNAYPLLYAYFSKDSCNSIPGIKVSLTPAMIEKIRTVIQTRYKK